MTFRLIVSPEVINIQRREEELNIILPRVNNFYIKRKNAWNICFFYATNTREVFFVKIELQRITITI